MAKLSDTARTVLSAAAARDDLRALPLPDTLRAPPHVVTKTLTALIEAGLLAEVTALPDDAIWTESAAGGRVALVETPAGLAAIGIAPEGATAAGSAGESPSSGRVRRAGSSRTSGAKGATRSANSEDGTKQSKQDIVLTLLRRPQGASVAEMVGATGWQPHSVRGFLTGVAKKRLKLEVTSKKDELGERRYHVAEPTE